MERTSPAMIVTPRTLPFHFDDVFAVAPLTGNALVVVEDEATAYARFFNPTVGIPEYRS